MVLTSVADPGSGVFLTPRYGIRDPGRVFSDLGSPIHISESLVTIFYVKSTQFFVNWLKLFCTPVQYEIFYNFVKFLAAKKVKTTNFFPSFVVVVRSKIRDG